MDRISFVDVDLLPCSCGFVGVPNAVTLAALNEPDDQLSSYDSIEEMLADLDADD